MKPHFMIITIIQSLSFNKENSSCLVRILGGDIVIGVNAVSSLIIGGETSMVNEEDIDTSTVKYLIHQKFSINGVAERSDIIGALFGQTEGLIGEGLDLRELQKTSRIGRISVNLQYQKRQRKSGL